MPREYDIPVSAPANAVVPGSPQDPFYFSTGQYKDVTLPDGRVVRALDVGSTKPPAAGGVGSFSPATGLEITGTERSMFREREAQKIGYTPEYIAARGGINEQGYFNDTPIYGQLTAEERKSLTLPDGTIDSNRALALLNQKEYNFYYNKIKQENPGWTEENIKSFTNDMMQARGLGGYGAGGAGSFGGGVSAGGFDAQGNPTPGGQYNAQGQVVGNGLGGEFAGAVGTPEQIAARKSAYDLLYEQFSQYGLGALVEPLKGLVMEGVWPRPSRDATGCDIRGLHGG